MADSASQAGATIIKLHELIATAALPQARELLAEMHPAAVADALESLPVKPRETLWGLIDPVQEGEVLSHLQDPVRSELLEHMRPQEVAEVTQALDTDDAVDIIQDLPEAMRDSVLFSMDEQSRQRVASVLSYPEDTAGGLMNTDMIAVPADVSLRVVMRYLKRLPCIPAKTDNLMVTDRNKKYLGTLALTDILLRDLSLSVAEVMHEEPAVLATSPNSDIAKIFEQRDLISIAVVDAKGALLGRITVDDVVDVIQETAEDTFRSMAGLSEDDMFAPVYTSAKRRSLWLGINLATAFLGAWVIGRFADTIQQLVALAVLMPIVAGMGGIAGSQTLTIAIRGIALDQLSQNNAKALILKETGVGLVNGFVWACVVGLIVALWFQDRPLGGIISLAMALNLTIASLAGALIPLILKRCGVDPAIAGGVVLTTVTDVVGFMSFLGLATLFLIR